MGERVRISSDAQMKGGLLVNGYCSDHAIYRALERYNFKINSAKAKKIVDLIKKKRCRVINKDSHGCTIYLVHFKRHYYKIVYDHKSGTIVTFLPFSPKEFEASLV